MMNDEEAARTLSELGRTPDMFTVHSGAVPTPGPETVMSAAYKDRFQYWYLDHIIVRVDDGICLSYNMASYAYHNVLMQHMLRMTNAKFYRLPYRENMVHIDIRSASPSAARFFHSYCQMFSAKRGDLEEGNLDFQRRLYQQTGIVPLEPRFIAFRLSPQSNRFLNLGRVPDLNATTSDHSGPVTNHPRPANMVQLEEMRLQGDATLPDGADLVAPPCPVRSPRKDPQPRRNPLYSAPRTRKVYKPRVKRDSRQAGRTVTLAARNAAESCSVHAKTPTLENVDGSEPQLHLG